MDTAVLIVDDSPTDAAILLAALGNSGCQWPIRVVYTGDKALECLQRLEADSLPYPKLIILDLNLPGKTGHEVLSEIKQNTIWQTIPTVIMSSSAMPGDIDKSYQLHANAYITKPMDFGDYQVIAQKLQEFWLNTVQPPTITMPWSS